MQSILLNGLNSQQTLVVEQTDGAVLVLAGAGSGKTKALTHRLSFLLEQGLALPNEILAVTFTNKAAREMEKRVYDLLVKVNYPIQEPLSLSTFHSFGAKILRRHAQQLGLQNNFTIYDDQDQLQMVKAVLHQLNIPEAQFEPKQAQRLINQKKAEVQDFKPTAYKPKFMMFEEIFQRYEKNMQAGNAVDFGDLLYKTYILFTRYPEILSVYSNQFRYVMVDEYQDTNYLQYRLIQLLSQTHRNLCVVGDEDQSIYSWRGADIQNILNFEKDFPESQTIRLEQNYRSTKNIVEAASHMIRNNVSRKGKELFTENPSGDLIQLIIEPSDFDEAKMVARKIEQFIQSDQVNPGGCAVLYRTNAQSRLIEEQLRLKQIPYRIVGGVRFYDRAEIKDVLGYMRLICNPKDDLALKRVINTPARGIGKTTIDKLSDLAVQQGLSLWEACHFACQQRSLPSGTLNKIQGFLKTLDQLSESQSQVSLLDFYVKLLDQTQYLATLEKENSEESKARIQNLEEFSNAIEQFQQEREEPTLLLFLEEMSLVSDLDQVQVGADTVTLMTVHMAKGLEFSYVFVVGLEESLFPSLRGEENEEALEEERRLFYVAMTRAEKKLFLSAARTRRVWGQAQSNPIARFISEIPSKYLQPAKQSAVSSFSSRFSHKTNSSWDDDYSQQSYYDDEGSSFNTSLGYRSGLKVKHPSFGRGVIKSVEGQGDDTKLTVQFEGQSLKRFIAKYAKLELLG